MDDACLKRRVGNPHLASLVLSRVSFDFEGIENLRIGLGKLISTSEARVGIPRLFVLRIRKGGESPLFRSAGISDPTID